MNYKQLISEIAQEEGLKKQVSVGNIREIVKIIAKKVADKETAEETVNLLVRIGKRHLRKK